MSMCYWVIDGIGINVDDVRDYVSKEKAARFLNELHPENTELADMISSNDYSRFDLEEYSYEIGFDNLADVLCHCDDTDTLIFGNDGDGGVYFYYPPSMPWHHTENEPKSEEEVISRIIKAVQKIADMTENEIRRVIDNDLYAVGAG